MSEENKALVGRYFEAIDDNDAGVWDLLDDFLATDFVSHGGLPPGIDPDREGVKQAAELFRRATPGRHVVVDQIAEGGRVVTRIRGYGKHTGDTSVFLPQATTSRSKGWPSTGSRTEDH